mmetsp:Transcript_35747/g.85398  ORF Transcript_35747/g.85398 Transcript_35747/m.85398 type:complete len:267 (+) Transcript_35747:221-1021(+)
MRLRTAGRAARQQYQGTLSVALQCCLRRVQRCDSSHDARGPKRGCRHPALWFSNQAAQQGTCKLLHARGREVPPHGLERRRRAATCHDLRPRGGTARQGPQCAAGGGLGLRAVGVRAHGGQHEPDPAEAQHLVRAGGAAGSEVREDGAAGLLDLRLAPAEEHRVQDLPHGALREQRGAQPDVAAGGQRADDPEAEEPRRGQRPVHFQELQGRPRRLLGHGQSRSLPLGHALSRHEAVEAPAAEGGVEEGKVNPVRILMERLGHLLL